MLNDGDFYYSLNGFFYQKRCDFARNRSGNTELTHKLRQRVVLTFGRGIHDKRT